MIDNDIKEYLSECFVKLIASNNGYEMETVGKDNSGIDVRIMSKELINYNGNKIVESDDRLDFQLKSTTEKSIKRTGKFIKYKLRVTNYDKLVYYRNKSRTIPRFLVLFVLPEDKLDWLSINANHLKLKKHAYWYIPELGSKPAIGKKADSQIEIEIPIENRFNEHTIKTLFKYCPA